MDEDCLTDALLVDVVQQGKSDRQAICSRYDDPEEAWLDGYVAGWFKGHFQQSSSEDPLKEERDLCDLSSSYGSCASYSG